MHEKFHKDKEISDYKPFDVLTIGRLLYLWETLFSNVRNEVVRMKKGTFNIRNFFKKVLLLCAIAFCPLQVFAAPVVFYTDIIRGPNNVGENANGTYLSIFGTGFGDSQGSSKVYINNTEVATYKYWGTSLFGRSDIQQITVQPGFGVSTGAIKIVVDGEDSNIDHTFTVSSGDIYFLANNGNNSIGTANDITKPYLGADYVVNLAAFGPGDTMVVRGGTHTVDSSYNDQWIHWDSANQKATTETTPIMIMGYPGETPFINTAGPLMGWYSNSTGYVYVSGLSVNSGNDPAMAGFKHGYRIVNIETTGFDGTGGGGSASLESGKCSNSKILGCKIHDNTGSKLDHAIYIDLQWASVDNHDIEIAYNHIYNQGGGSGIQVYHGTSVYSIYNVSIHHNRIHGIDRWGIDLASGQVTTGFEVYNNVLYDMANGGESERGAIRLIGGNLDGLKVFNNTLYDFELVGISFDNYGSGVEVKNNIIRALSAQSYIAGDCSSAAVSNNLWYGAGSAPSCDSDPVNSDPLFVNPAAGDLHLTADSPCKDTGTPTVSGSGVVTTDFDGNPRPQGDEYDIGAYEFAEPPPEGPESILIQI